MMPPTIDVDRPDAGADRHLAEVDKELGIPQWKVARVEVEPPDEDAVDQIYDIVDAVVSRTDDPTIPANTARAWVLGMILCVALSFINTLFSFRTNQFYTNPIIGVLLAYPLAILLARVIPRHLRVLGIDLNPGPFSLKEHALIYVCCSAGSNTAFAIYNVVGQRYKLGQDLSIAWGLAFAVVSQIFGYGLAGLCRRYLVRPVAMLWPTNLSTIAMLNSLHEDPGGGGGGRKRFTFFCIAAVVVFAYEWLPIYIMPVLSVFSFLCWITPFGSDIRFFASAQSGGGVGMLSLSFDWALIGPFNPITSPLWAVLNQLLGLWVINWIAVPILYKSNAFGNDQNIGVEQGPNSTMATFPMGRALNTPALFDRDGVNFRAQRLVNKVNLTLNEPFYDSVAPIRLTTLYAVYFACNFAVFSATIVHVFLWYGPEIWHRFRSAVRDLDHDLHSRLMDAYPDVPDSWYAILLGINTLAAIMICQFGGFDLPWWGVLLALGISIVSILPIGVIQAISGQQVGINVMSEFLMGLILPGRLVAVMTFKTLSFMSIAQALSLVSDLKLAHYMKIPPRTMFLFQMAATVISAVVNIVTACFLYESFGRSKTTLIDRSDPKSPYEWVLDTTEAPVGWTAVGYTVFVNSGAIWGAVGPARFFGPASPYYRTLFSFIVGAVLPLIPWQLHKHYPAGYWHLVNVPLIFIMPDLPGMTQSGLITSLVIAVLFNYFIKKYRHLWWKRYAYVLSASLDTGLAFALTVQFFAIYYNASYLLPFPAWIGNPVDQEHCAPDYYLTCTMNAQQGEARGGVYDFAQDAFCTIIIYVDIKGVFIPLHNVTPDKSVGLEIGAMLAAGHPINDTAPTDATASPVVAGHTVDEVVAALQGLTPTKTNIRGPPLRAPQPAKSPRPPSSSSSSGLPRASSAPGKASSPSVMPRKSPAASHPAQSADPASPPSTITGNARDRVTFSDASSPPSVTGGTAAKGVGQPQRPPWNPDTLTPSKKRESSLIGPGKRIDRSPTTPRPQEGGGGAACREVNQLRGHRTAEVAQGKNAFMMQIEDLSKKPLTGEGVNGIAPAAEPVDRMVVDHDWTMGPPPPVPKRSVRRTSSAGSMLPPDNRSKDEMKALRKALEDEKKLVLKMLDDINAKETKIEALEAKLKRGADKAIKDTNVEELVNERLREKEVEHQEALKALTDRFTAMNYTLSKKLDFALSMLDDEQRLAVSKCTYLDTIGVKIADKSEDPASSNSASVMQMMSAITLDEEGMETS